jgi:hypothetical protein
MTTARHMGLLWTCGLAVTVAATVTPASEPTDRLENATAGIVVVKPAGWHVGTIQQVEENRARVRMNDEELQKAIRQSASAPLFVFTRYPEPHDNLNPSIQVALRPLGPLAGKTPVEILEVAVEPLKKAFTDFRLLSEISATTVGGMPAASMKATYKLVTQDGREYPTLSRLWIIPRGSFMFFIGMGGPQEGPDVSEAEFTAFVNSIEIKP